MNISALEKIMVEYGLVLRAIPQKVVSIVEKRHAARYPEGRIEYLEDFKREMLVVERVPKHAGKFIWKQEKNTSATVEFNTRKVFDSIQEAIDDVLKTNL